MAAHSEEGARDSDQGSIPSIVTENSIADKSHHDQEEDLLTSSTTAASATVKASDLNNITQSLCLTTEALAHRNIQQDSRCPQEGVESFVQSLPRHRNIKFDGDEANQTSIPHKCLETCLKTRNRCIGNGRSTKFNRVEYFDAESSGREGMVRESGEN